MYQAGDLAGIGLNEDALVLVALLAGGDYSVRSLSHPLPCYGLPTYPFFRMACAGVASRRHTHLRRQGLVHGSFRESGIILTIP
jgi:hypothetical protein